MSDVEHLGPPEYQVTEFDVALAQEFIKFAAEHAERRRAIHAIEGDGTGEALPPLPDDVYPDGASFLRSLDEG